VTKKKKKLLGNDKAKLKEFVRAHSNLFHFKYVTCSPHLVITHWLILTNELAV
jgi:hypothetical protein